MPDSIDYDFISGREGGRLTNGYVPAAGASKSGVTIATGFDLGARNEGDLGRLSLSKELTNKLRPYLGKIKDDAERVLKKNAVDAYSGGGRSHRQGCKEGAGRNVDDALPGGGGQQGKEGFL